MNYGDLRTFFLSLLNRDDCNDTLASTFISMGLRRVERLLRTPLQRRTLIVAASPSVTIPADYIGLHHILVDGVHIGRITPTQKEDSAGFLIERGQFFFYPEPSPDSEIAIEYYTEFRDDVADGSTTNYSLVLTDVIVYAALTYACDYFLDTRKQGFEATMSALVIEVQAMADQDEFSGGGMAITPWGGGII